MSLTSVMQGGCRMVSKFAFVFGDMEAVCPIRATAIEDRPASGSAGKEEQKVEEKKRQGKDATRSKIVLALGTEQEALRART